jgi:adenine-specific DNA-methyltransferase
MAPVVLNGKPYSPPRDRCWSHVSKPQEQGLSGMERVAASGRLMASSTSLDFKRYLDDFPYKTISNWWDGLGGAANPIYVVQTNERVLERLILMTSDPGDLVLDPTCGSGPPLTSPSNGAAAGSRLIPVAFHWRSRVRA